MKTAALCCLMYAGLLGTAIANAETLVVNDQLVVAPADVARPDRGSTMTAVTARFGAPQSRHDAVGKPPITRWDYAGFVVYFERDRVIHAVAINH